jgi:hypothetical protein
MRIPLVREVGARLTDVVNMSLQGTTGEWSVSGRKIFRRSVKGFRSSWCRFLKGMD